MRRWNGWGDPGTVQPLPESGLQFLAVRAGATQAPADAGLESALAMVPDSRLQDWSGVDASALARLGHARGQSLPDWLAMRHGRMGPFPDAVATPRSHAQVVELVAEAVRRGVVVIPYGGGTSVVGHLGPPSGSRPVLSVDLGLLARMTALDETNRLATIGAGAPGPVVEAQLQAAGYTLGHYPQSWEYSTLGGWVAARSSGQESLRYGRIEQLFAGGRLVSPAGELDLPPIPASSAGPDLRELVLGSEGRLGILTEAAVRVRPVPEREAAYGVFFRDWSAAITAVRHLAQARLPLAMLRLSNPAETETQLMLADASRGIGALDRYLRLRGAGEGRCMLLIAIAGERREFRFARRRALDLARKFGGLVAGQAVGRAWRRSRFSGAYLRNSLWDAGYAVDTVETAVNWSRVTATMRSVEDAARQALADWDERLHVFAHLSHVYPQGSSIYTTFVYRLSGDYDTDLARWKGLKSRVCETIVTQGGTISHQHGVGIDHKPYLPAEKGELGIIVLRDALRALDPDGLMNPGKLLD